MGFVKDFPGDMVEISRRKKYARLIKKVGRIVLFVLSQGGTSMFWGRP